MPAMLLKFWRICTIFTGLFACLKRLLFWRRKSKEKEDLPYTSKQIGTDNPIPGQQSGEVELKDWNEWGADDIPTSIRVEPSNPTPPLSPTEEEKHEADIDFFNDMTPQLKKTKVLRKKPVVHASHFRPHPSASNKFSMESVPLANSGELGAWEESSGAWEEDTSEDLSEEAEAAIREKRRLDREGRLAHHQRLKEERLAHPNKKDRDRDSKLVAIKLS